MRYLSLEELELSRQCRNHELIDNRMRCKLTDLWRSHELRTDLEEEELATSH
jgi:hypothetical protein